MPVSVDDADECQKCEENEATQTAQVTVGGIPLGPLFVCDECADSNSKSDGGDR